MFLHADLLLSNFMLQLSVSEAQALCAGFQWDYVFDWTILKYQQTKNHAMPRPDAAPAAQADPADTDKGDRSGFARASRGDSGRRYVHSCIPRNQNVKHLDSLHVWQL